MSATAVYTTTGAAAGTRDACGDCKPECESATPFSTAFGASSSLGVRVGSMASPLMSMVRPVTGARGLCAPEKVPEVCAVRGAGTAGVAVTVAAAIGAPMHQPGSHPMSGAMARRTDSHNQDMAAAFAAAAAAPASMALKSAAEKNQSIFEAIGAERIVVETRLTQISGSAALFSTSPSMLVDAPLSGMAVQVNNSLTGEQAQYTTGLVKKISVASFTNTAEVSVGLKWTAAEHSVGSYIHNATGQAYDFVVAPGVTHVFNEPKVVYRNSATINGDLARKYNDMPLPKVIEGCKLHQDLSPPAFTVPESSPMFQLVVTNIEEHLKIKPEKMGRYQGEALVPASFVQFLLNELHDHVHSKMNAMPLDQLMTVTASPLGGTWTNGDAFNNLVASQLDAVARKAPIQVFIEWQVEYAPY